LRRTCRRRCTLVGAPERIGGCEFAPGRAGIVHPFAREPPSILAGSACGAATSNYLTLDAKLLTIAGASGSDVAFPRRLHSSLAGTTTWPDSKGQLAKCSAAASHLAQLVYARAREHLANKRCGMERLAQSLFQTGASVLGYHLSGQLCFHRGKRSGAAKRGDPTETRKAKSQFSLGVTGPEHVAYIPHAAGKIGQRSVKNGSTAATAAPGGI
jgi:hypothetical protein